MIRFLAGLLVGAAVAAVVYANPNTRAAWWILGAVTALLIWAGRHRASG